ncbi:hypothetical protein ENU1_076200 [Entamoeba nuttalli P19]|uniref:Uncharacterized protein n=1 Tax=Entamoeba nuttalli (strain P19) TaxID=1076696 RepID=K2HDL4_ENTNP|nr:hypothetical protein ENU1_076200 [Entamoeba nuttalli P19]EKE40894.1 hypothetical protein ENU1_076200 [Entamoeba nuttalli P19]|eukprot:XP_008856775.1 hypothetical protein ENU1_076200 [Entamoeba nuttalli P19]
MMFAIFVVKLDIGHVIVRKNDIEEEIDLLLEEDVIVEGIVHVLDHVLDLLIQEDIQGHQVDVIDIHHLVQTQGHVLALLIQDIPKDILDIAIVQILVLLFLEVHLLQNVTQAKGRINQLKMKTSQLKKIPKQ